MNENSEEFIHKNEILDQLFRIREEEFEKVTEDEKKFIKDNNLQEINQKYLKNQIETLPNISNETKNRLIEDLDKLIENKGLIDSYKCKKYYIAGINDVINIIFNKEFGREIYK